MAKGSSKAAGKTSGAIVGGRVYGSNRAGGPTEIDSMGGQPGGSNVAGTNMVQVGGNQKGSSFPNMMKGGNKPSGSSKPNMMTGGGKPKGSSVAAGKIAMFHKTRGASKL